MEIETKAICRRGYRIILPCNWVKEGYCGEDGKKCGILFIVE